MSIADAGGRRPFRRICSILGMAALLALGGLTGCAPTLQPMGERAVQPAIALDSFHTADGIALPMRSWLPEGQPRAVILALHGFNDHSLAFTEAGEYWSRHGIATYAYDQRGFGAAPKPGIWPGTETLHADLLDAAVAIGKQHPGVPLFLMGHSMGGAVVMTALVQYGLPPGVEGVVLVAPAVWSRDTMPFYLRAALAVGNWTVPWIQLTPPKGVRRYASDNIEMLRSMGRDPLVLKTTRIDAIAGLTDLMDAAMQAVPDVVGPVLVMYGDNEDILPAGPVNRALSLFRPDEVGPDVAVYPQGWHLLLRDLNAEIVWRDVLSWIGNRDAPLPSGADNRPRRIPVREGRPDLPQQRTAGAEPPTVAGSVTPVGGVVGGGADGNGQGQ